MEITRRMVNGCIEKGVQYTGKSYSKHTGRPYLLKDSNELNILADCIKIRPNLQYKTSLINCHLEKQGFDAVYKSTVNTAFKRNQPRIKPPRKSQNLQGKIVSGKRQECAKQIKCRL